MARRDDIRAFAGRPWETLAASKAEHWSRWRRRHGAGGAIRIADELRREVQARRPDWPSEAERALDLESHVRVSEALRRVRSRR